MKSLLLRLSTLWRRRGYVYAAEADAGGLQGDIVVDHSLESVVLAKWPGRLWRVEILKAASEQPVASANYTRAVSVRVLEELPVSVLFGPQGREVSAVIDRAAALTLEEAAALSSASRPDARSAYSRAWQAWLGETGEDHSDTLAISGGNRERSPVGSALTVLQSVIVKRASVVAGDDAFVIDDDGEQSLVPPWADAASALSQAAMGFGAPQLVSADDARLLTEAWTKCLKS